MPELGKTLGEALLTPTKIYVKPVLSVMQKFAIHAVSHITGGGFYENVPRMMKPGLSAKIDLTAFPKPAVFSLLQEKGCIPPREMYNTFNMGIGMVVAVAEEDVRTTMAAMKAAGDIPYIIGSIEAGEKGVTLC